MQNKEDQILQSYQDLIIKASAHISKLKAEIDKLSIIRLLLLVVEIILFIFLVNAVSDFAIVFFVLSMFIPITFFVVVVKKQNRLTEEQTYQKNLLWVYQNEANILNGLENGYDNGVSFEDENHPYLADLDIFGKGSLYALINRAITKRGADTLAQQLTVTNEKHNILLRQEAIKDMLSSIADTFSFRALLKEINNNIISQLKTKLTSNLPNQLSFTRNKGLRFYIKLLPIAMPILFITALILGGKVWGILAIVILVNAGLTFFLMSKINLVYFGFGGTSTMLTSYADAIKWIEKKDWQSVYIKNLLGSKEKVSHQIRNLSQIIQAFDARLNILVGSFLNFFLLWDLKCCVKLDKWQESSSKNVIEGIDNISYFEELIAMATLSYNHPEWIFPCINDDFCLNATELGHPLIIKKKRIVNDFDLAHAPTVNIITGSNMAGKSTFLRTIGINMVLAYAGAPVCAKAMKLSIFKIFTYMRIKDSLNESTSTFKAELNRLKMILESVVIENNPLVLIDEMLRGTNSHDKYLGSKVFIEKMIEVNSPTLFATHDLQLSELKNEHPASIRNYHFDIQIEKGEMNFDYKLKDGPCTIFNAAILLKQIGLSLD